MLLCDLIGQAAAWADQPTRLGLPAAAAASPIYREQARLARAVAADLAGAPRYVLADEVIAAATHVLSSRPRSMHDCVAAFRVPFPTAFVEWRDAVRVGVYREMEVGYDNGHSTPSRFGFHVTSAPDGRRGSVRFCWAHENDPTLPGKIPSISPILVHFDLDRMTDPSVPLPPESYRRASPLYQRWGDTPAERDALDALNRLCWVEYTEDAYTMAATIARQAGHPEAGRAWLQQAWGDIEGEHFPFLAVMMLLSARNGIETRPEERGKLNRARAKRGEPALFDHVVAYLRLSKGEARSGVRLGDGAPGRGRRTHMVCGHFVVRRTPKETIYWRRGHARGLASGLPAATRTVKVSL